MDTWLAKMRDRQNERLNIPTCAHKSIRYNAGHLKERWIGERFYLPACGCAASRTGWSASRIQCTDAVSPPCGFCNVIGQENHEYSMDVISFSYENIIFKIKISEYRNYKDKLENVIVYKGHTKGMCFIHGSSLLTVYNTCYISKERWPTYKTSACGSPLPSNSEKGISCEYAHLHSMSLTSQKVKLKKNCQDEKPRERKTYWMKNRYMS